MTEMIAPSTAVSVSALMVVREERNKGIARQLVERVESQAHSDGQKDIWLLTTTADRYFARIGYRTVERNNVSEEVRLTQQFSSLCTATAVCMRKTLGLITSMPSR